MLLPLSAPDNLVAVKRTDAESRLLADRHYSRQTPGAREFMGNGRTLVLRDLAGSVVFGWLYPQHHAVPGVSCTIFRNESERLSSDIILEAEQHALERWGGGLTVLHVRRSATRAEPEPRLLLQGGWLPICRRQPARLPLAHQGSCYVSSELHCGDALDVLRTLTDQSVQCCVTSPPYWGLRDYGTPGQLGLEPTPEAYVEKIVEIFSEIRRVLRKDGTLWLNMGDCYATQPNGNVGNTGLHDGGQARRRIGSAKTYAHPHDEDDRTFRDKPFNTIVAGLKPKDLVGLPWLLAFALRADGWWLRSDIVWSKPNPMPESVTDRPTKAHEYVFLLSRSERYFYDAEAIREPAQYVGPNGPQHSPYGQGFTRRSEERLPSGWNTGPGGDNGDRIGRYANHKNVTRPDTKPGDRLHDLNQNWDASEANGTAPLTRNKRSVWTIATQPYPGAHFATFPEALVEPCILAGTSERGACADCGAPWRRMVSVEYVKSPVHGDSSVVGRHYATGSNGWDGAAMPRVNRAATTSGWEPTCAHTSCSPVPCTVLDPFAGSGTTLAVAKGLDRDYIGIELNPAYVRLAERRLAQTGRQMAAVL